MRLITRLDFDGIVCAAMISKMEVIHEYQFSNPKEVEDRMIDIDFGDTIAHLPFHPDSRLWFHNHDVSHLNPVLLKGVRGKWGKSPSSSRQVFDYYNSPKLGAYEAIVKEVDRIGSADLSQDDILNPKGWVLVSYTLDPRFIAEHAYGTLLIESLREGKNAESIIALPAVQKRIERYQRDEKRYAEVLKQFSRVDGNVIVTDFRQCQDIPFGNRFFIFTQFPQANVHIRIDPVDILREKMSVGKSVINRSLKLDVGKLMEEFGGGGMEGAGTCFLGKKTADTRIQQIVDRLKA